ncbi:hypothetical protein JYT87_03635, partial [Nitrospira defluvii]|nr:hypothetical protein [Nitrospira defluvii]
MRSTDKSTSRSFTRRYDHIVEIISTPIFVYPAFNPDEVKRLPHGKMYSAIWDTAATSTVITHRVVDDLGLLSTGRVKV